jgi:hypothetical protein
MGMIAGMVMGAAGAEDKKVQLGVTVALLIGGETGGDYISGVFGPGARVDFNLTKSFMVSPEVSLLWGSISPGGTVNYRFGKGFAGLGAMVIWDEGAIGLFKAHVGAKGLHWLVAASYHRGGWISAVGLTVGYIF